MNLSYSGQRMRDRRSDFSYSLCLWNAVAILAGVWLSLDLYFSGAAIFAAYSIMNVVFLLIILGPSIWFFRVSPRHGWRFFHAANAITNGALLFRNLGGGPLMGLLNRSTLLPEAKDSMGTYVNVSACVAVLLVQFLILFIFTRRANRIALPPNSLASPLSIPFRGR
jgi:hypothetical protein